MRPASEEETVIVEVDRKPIRSIDEYKKAVAGIRKGKGVLLLVRRGESTLFLSAQAAELTSPCNPPAYERAAVTPRGPLFVAFD